MTSPGLLLLRESAAVARRPRAFLRRAVVLVLLAGIVVVAWSVGEPRDGVYTSQALGGLARALVNAFFVGLGLVLVFVMPGATGGLIAGEREEGSLELLRMTPLGPYQIVAEKFLSLVAVALQLLVLAGPLFCTPLFFGGVTAREIATAVLFPLSAAVWMAALGIVCSALHRRAASAVLWTYLAALAWHVLGGGLHSLLELTPDSRLGLLLLPLWACLGIPVEQDMSLHRPELLWQVPLASAAFAAACVVLAGWLTGREDAAGAPSLRDASPRSRAAVRGNPVAWKEIRMGHGTAVRRILVACLALGGFSVFWALPKRWPLSGMGYAMELVFIALGVLIAAGGLLGAAWPRRRRFYWTAALVAVATGLGMWGIAFAVTPRGSSNSGQMTAQVVLYPVVFAVVLLMMLGGAVAGATAVVHERVQKTAESLRMTPLPARAFILGKAVGCVWTLLPAAAVLLAAVAMLWLMRKMPASACALLLAVVACTLLAVIQMGLFVSARARRPAQAVLVALGLLAGYLFIVPLLSLLVMRGGSPELIFYLNPLYWIAELLTDYPAERRASALAGGCALFCAGAVAISLWFAALAAKAFESER